MEKVVITASLTTGTRDRVIRLEALLQSWEWGPSSDGPFGAGGLLAEINGSVHLMDSGLLVVGILSGLQLTGAVEGSSGQVKELDLRVFDLQGLGELRRADWSFTSS